jgi:hypothetical protein
MSEYKTVIYDTARIFTEDGDRAPTPEEREILTSILKKSMQHIKMPLTEEKVE